MTLKSFLLCWQISDHLPIIHNLTLKKSKPKYPKIKSRNFSADNVERFKKAIQNYKWDHVTTETCPQSAYTNFSNTLNNFIDIFFPETVKQFYRNIHRIEPWMTVGILTSRRKKGTLYKAQLKNPTVTNRDNFRAFRNLYNVAVRTAKKHFSTLKLKTTQKTYVKPGKFYPTLCVNLKITKKIALLLLLTVPISTIRH